MGGSVLCAQQTKAIAMKFEPRHPSTPTARVLFTLRRWPSPGIDFSIYVVHPTARVLCTLWRWPSPSNDFCIYVVVRKHGGPVQLLCDVIPSYYYISHTKALFIIYELVLWLAILLPARVARVQASLRTIWMCTGNCQTINNEYNI